MIDSQPQGLVYQLVAFLRKISGSHFKQKVRGSGGNARAFSIFTVYFSNIQKESPAKIARQFLLSISDGYICADWINHIIKNKSLPVDSGNTEKCQNLL